jgi:hypothetical protein
MYSNGIGSAAKVESSSASAEKKSKRQFINTESGFQSQDFVGIQKNTLGGTEKWGKNH